MDFQYKAFISYSHRDARWAQWLLGALETYRLPDSKTRGVGRVFRDRDEAGAGDLKDEIQRALAASEHLIVIASPNSAASKYVQAEIEYFAELNAQRDVPGRVLTLIVDGEPNVTTGAEPDPRECFPPALRGGVTKPDGTPLEPLAADARSVGDGRTRALAKLVAGLMDVRYDTLVRRDLLRRRRSRLLAAVASVAALAVAGVVAAVLISANLEQERLRAESESAARDVRTLNAVSDAGRARQLLEAGNPVAAQDLARRSLAVDGSLPFIPQAYDVLYRSLYDRAQEVDVDLVGYHRLLPVVLPLGDHAYFVYNDEGTAAIWTPSAGVVYRRADLAWETRPSLAADGSAVFVAGLSSLQRLSLPARTWSSIDLSPVFGDLSMPTLTVAIDANTFYACREWHLYKIAVDQQSRGAAVWQKPLGGPCTALALMPSGSALVGKRSAAYEITPDGEEARSWGPAGSQNLERAYATDDAVIIAHGGGTWVYRNGVGEPHYIERGMDYSALSPDGRWFVYGDIDNERMVVNDLREGTARDLTCVCLFVDYLGTDRFMTTAGQSIEAHRLDTLESTGNVYTFASGAESFVYLDGDNMLMALRRQGRDSVAFLDTDPNQTLVADGAQNLRRSIMSAAFTGTDRIITKSIDDDGLRLLDVGKSGLASVVDAPDLAGFSSLVQAIPLASGKLAVTDALTDRIGYSLGLYDGTSGSMLTEGIVLDPTGMRPGDRFVGMDSAEGLAVFDASTGATIKSPLQFDLWDIAGSDLVATAYDGNITTIGRFGIDKQISGARWTQQVEARVHLLCVAAEAGQVYVMRNVRVGHVLLERRALADGALTASLEVLRDGMFDDRDIPEIDRTDCDAASFRLRTFAGRQLRWDVNGASFEAEDAASTPPRGADAPDPGSAISLEALADARIGWDSEGSWLYDPSEDRIAVAFASSGARVSSSLYIASRGLAVIGFENGRVQVWDARFPTAPMIEVEAHTSPVVALDYDASRNRLMSADSEGSIHLWPMQAPAELLAASTR